MVVNNLNVMCIGLFPHKTDTPLVVDSDAVLSFSFPGECFKAIARRNSKIFNTSASVDHAQFPESDPLNGCGELSGMLAVEDLFGLLARETCYHANMV